MEKRKREKWRRTRCFEIILGFINILNLENNSRVFLRIQTRVFMGGGGKNGNEIWLLEGSFCRAR